MSAAVHSTRCRDVCSGVVVWTHTRAFKDWCLAYTESHTGSRCQQAAGASAGHKLLAEIDRRPWQGKSGRVHPPARAALTGSAMQRIRPVQTSNATPPLVRQPLHTSSLPTQLPLGQGASLCTYVCRQAELSPLPSLFVPCPGPLPLPQPSPLTSTCSARACRACAWGLWSPACRPPP